MSYSRIDVSVESCEENVEYWGVAYEREQGYTEVWLAESIILLLYILVLLFDSVWISPGVICAQCCLP